MKRWRLLVLIFELALFAAILVLPQVALPDLLSTLGPHRWRHIHVSVTRPPESRWRLSRRPCFQIKWLPCAARGPAFPLRRVFTPVFPGYAF